MKLTHNLKKYKFKWSKNKIIQNLIKIIKKIIFFINTKIKFNNKINLVPIKFSLLLKMFNF
jgi:hypothetical protein